MKQFKRIIISVAFIGLLSSCSDDQQNEATVQESVDSNLVTGIAAKGPILGATIEAYSFDGIGDPIGAPLGSTTTDANGLWSLSLGARTEPVLIVSSGGSFIDESDAEPDNDKKRRIAFASGDKLEGVLFPEFNTASISLLTYGLLEKSRGEVTAGDFIALLNRNRNLAIDSIGFDPFAVTSTSPLTPSASASDDALQYAMYLGGLANALNSTSIMMGKAAPDYVIMQGLIRDLSDGRLDGRDSAGVISVMVDGVPVDMPNNIDLNLAIRRFVNNNYIAYKEISVSWPQVDEEMLSTPVSNTAPVALNDSAFTSLNTPVTTIDVTANDVDPDGDAISITGFTQPANGSVVDNANGTFTYTPDTDFGGTDPFTYTVSDGLSGVATATVTVFVSGGGGGGTNTPPIANAGSDQPSVNEQTVVNLAGSGSDADGSIASYAWTQLNGTTVTLDDAGIQAPSFSAPVVLLTDIVDVLIFQLTVTDNLGSSASDFVTISVYPINIPPVADAGLDQTQNESITVNMDASSSSDDGSVVAYGWTQTAGTAVSLIGATTVTPSFVGPHIGSDETLTFELTVTDNEGATATDSININLLTVNVGPTLTDDVATTAEDTAIILSTLKVNDSDPESDAISITGVSAAANGSTVLNADKTITYTPALNFNGSDTFTYTAEDAFAAAGVNTATVTITVTAVNDDPVAFVDAVATIADTPVTTADVTSNDTDVDFDILSVTAFTPPANGTVNNNGDNTFTYIPDAGYNGSDVFSYTISDGAGGSATANVMVTVGVGGGSNVAPTADAGLDQPAIDEQTTVTLAGSGLDSDGTVTAYNWSQVSGDATVSIINATLATASFSAPVVLIGSVDALVFELKVTDNEGATGTDYVTVIVNPVNPLPTANAGVDQTLNEMLLVFLDASGSTDDGSIVSYNWLQTAGTTVVLDDVKIAAPRFTGPDIINDETLTFAVTVTDDEGGSATDTVNINLISLNAGPTLVNDLGYTTDEDNAVVINDLTTNDSDPESDPIIITSVTDGANGTVAITDVNQVTFTPTLNANGTGTFTYSAEDNLGAISTNSATVTISITAVNDAPVAVADTATMNQGTSITISDMLDNDTDVENGFLVLVGVNAIGTQDGSVVNNGDGSLTYTPLSAFSGSEDITYTINDGQGGSASGIITVTVNADSDGDSITDFDESNGATVTDPNLADSDGDGFYDQHEFAAGTNPNDPNEFPATKIIVDDIDRIISSDTIWTLANAPYWVQADLVIQNGATLTIEAGVVVKLNSGVDIDVQGGGTLNTLGENPLPQRVILTSSLDDTTNGDTNGDSNSSTPSAGNWPGLEFLANANGQVRNTNIYFAASCLYVTDASPTFNGMEIGDCSSYGVDFRVNSSNTHNANFSNILIRDIDGNGIATTYHGMYFSAASTSTLQMNTSNIEIRKAGANTSYHSMYFYASGGSIRGAVDQLTVNNAKGRGLYLLNAGGGNFDTTFSNIAITSPALGAIYIDRNSTGALSPTFDGTNTITGVSSSYHSIQVDNASPIFASTGSTTTDSGWSGLALALGSTGDYENISISNASIAAVSLSGNSVPTSFVNVSISGSPTPFNIGGQSLPAVVFDGTSFPTLPGMSIRFNGTVVADTILDEDPLGTLSSVWNISSSVTVNAGVTLTVTDNAILKMNPGVILYVSGTLDVTASAGNEAIFTSIKDDVLSDTNGDSTVTSPARGNWGYIQAYGGSSVNLDNAIVRYAQYGLYSYNATVNATLSNTTITEISNYALYGYNLGIGNYTLTNVTFSNVTNYDAFYMFADTGDAVTLNINGLTIDGIGDGTADRAFDFTINNNATLTGTWQNITISNIAGGGIYVFDNSTGTVDPLLSAITINPTLGAGTAGILFDGDATTKPTINGSVGDNLINAGGYGLALYGVGGSYSDITIDGVANAAIIFSDNASPASWDDSTIVLQNLPSPFRLRTSLPTTVGVLGTADQGYIAGTGLDLDYLEVQGTMADTNLVADPLNTGASVYYAPGNITVPTGVTFNLDVNAILKMELNTIIYVNGTLSSNASAGNEAIITSIRDDVLFDTNGDLITTTPARGNWNYIQTYSGSLINFDNAIIRYAQYGLYSYNATVNATLSNTTITEMSNYGIYGYNLGVSSYGMTNSVISNVTSNDGFYLQADTGDAVTLDINGLTIDGIGDGTADHAFEFIINNNATLTGNWLNLTASNIVGGAFYITDNSTGIVDPLISGLTISPAMSSGQIGLYFSGDTTTTPILDGSVGTNVFNSGGYGLGLYGVGGSYSNITVDGVDRAAIIFTDNASPASWDDASIVLSNSPSPYLLRTELPAIVGTLGTTDLGYTVGTGLIENYVHVNGSLADISLIADPLNTGSSVYYAMGNITVPTGIALNLEDNAILKMELDVITYVSGTLSTTSTAGNETIITSIRDDVLADTNGDVDATAAARSDWNYIQMNSGSLVNLDNAIIRYADYGLYSYNAVIDATLSNSTITEMYVYGIYGYNFAVSNFSLINSTISNVTANDGVYLQPDNGDFLTLNFDGLTINGIGDGTADHAIHLNPTGDSVLTGTLKNINISNIAGSGIYINSTSTGLVDPLLSAITINPTIGGHGIYFIGNANTSPTINASVGANFINDGGYGLLLNGLGVGGSYSDITIDGSEFASLYFANGAEPDFMSNIILTNSPSPYALVSQGVPINLSFNASAGSAVKDFVRLNGTLIADATFGADPLGTGSSYWHVVNTLRTGSNLITLSANTLFKFDSGYHFYVDSGGSLNVNGSLDNEVIMTSFTDDNVGNPATSSASRNSWEGLRFENGSNGGTISYLNTYFARYGALMYGMSTSPVFNDFLASYSQYGIYLTPGSTNIDPSFVNVSIQEPQTHGVYFRDTNTMAPTFTGTLQITDVLDPYASNCIYNQSSSIAINITGWLISGCNNGINLSNPSAGTYSNNIIRQADYRGIYLNSSTALTINDNIIVNNGNARGPGAGIYVDSTTIGTTIKNNLIRHNIANTSGGGGMYIDTTGGNIEVSNNLIVENHTTSTSLSGGVYFAANTTVDFYNNTIVDNTALGASNLEVGLGIGVTGNAVNVHDNIIYNNTDTDSIEDFDDLNTGGAYSNNTSTDPTFEQGWYLSTSGSGAIDAGSVLASTVFTANQTTNVLGSQDTGNVDLGYHFDAGETTVDAINSTAVLSSATTVQNVAVTLTIVAKNSASTTIGAALDVSVTVEDVSSNLGSVIDQGDGSYTVSYQPTSPGGTDNLTATVNGVALSTKPLITW